MWANPTERCCRPIRERACLAGGVSALSSPRLTTARSMAGSLPNGESHSYAGSGSADHAGTRLDDLHSVVLHVVIRLKIRANLDAPGALSSRSELKSAETDMFG